MTNEIKPPKQGSLRDQICLLLMRVGPKPTKEIHHIMNKLSRRSIDQALYELTKNGTLAHKDSRYSVSDALAGHYRALAQAIHTSEVASVRTATEPRPLQAKNIPSLNPLIADRLRTDSGYKSSDISLAPFYGAPI